MGKAMIIYAGGRYDPDSLTLKECGLKAGDIVEFDRIYNDGSIFTKAPKDMIPFGIRNGDNISINKEEFVVL